MSKIAEKKIEKYPSGVTHPSEVIAMFRKLDIDDKEKFIDALLEEDDVMAYIKDWYFYV